MYIDVRTGIFHEGRGNVTRRLSLLLLLSGAFLLGVGAGNSVTLQESLAQGYTGLIAGGGNDKKTNDQPLGYKGLIPGYVPPAQQQQAPATAPQQQQSRKPGAVTAPPAQAAAPRVPSSRQHRENISYQPGYSPSTIRTIDDIKFRAGRKAQADINWEEGQIPPQIEKTLFRALSPREKDILSAPAMRVKGMMPREYTTKKKIDSLMSFVANPSLPPEERRINAEKARQKLVQHAQYLEIKARVPDAIYEKMGLPGSYVRETREDVRKSLALVEAALNNLKKYR